MMRMQVCFGDYQTVLKNLLDLFLNGLSFKVDPYLLVPELEDEIEELMDDTRDDVKFIALPQAPLKDETKEGCKHYRRFCQKKVF